MIKGLYCFGLAPVRTHYGPQVLALGCYKLFLFDAHYALDGICRQVHNAVMAKRINVNLDDLLTARGINLHRLSKLSGVNYKTLFRLRHEMKRIPLDVLAKVCAALQCSPGDILQLVECDGPPRRADRPTELT